LPRHLMSVMFDLITKHAVTTLALWQVAPS
jgi:hypothetical protein